MSQPTVNQETKLNGGSDPILVVRIPFHRLRVSPTNPRKSSNPEQDKELANSIKQDFEAGGPGVLEPLLCRPIPGELIEVIAGSRRFKAAQAAGLDDVPCLVREMSDQQALEIQIVENLQRADISAIDQARGFKNLAETIKVGEIAKRVGKSASYIYDSMSLCDLIPAAQKHMEDRSLPTSHARNIARLPASAQEKAMEWCFPPNKYYKEQNEERPNVSVKHLAELIRTNIGTNLKNATFDTTDPKLLPVAGTCSHCPKRAGNDPKFKNFPKETCMDRQCYDAKTKAAIDATITKARDSKTPMLEYNHKTAPKLSIIYTHSEKCETIKEAIVNVPGNPEHGKTIKVCDNPKCKTHYHGGSGSGDAAWKKAQKRRKQEMEIKGRALALALSSPKWGVKNKSAVHVAIFHLAVEAADNMRHSIPMPLEKTTGGEWENLKDLMGTTTKALYKVPPVKLEIATLTLLAVMGKIDIGQDRYIKLASAEIKNPKKKKPGNPIAKNKAKPKAKGKSKAKAKK